MKVQVNIAALKQTKWYQYAIRFLLGASITVCAGLIAEKFGPELGGLFLAFPAIFPASATLIEKHEKERKQRSGLLPGHRGQDAAALDAAGAAMGSIALILFAILMWQSLPGHSTFLVLAWSTAAWFALAVLLCYLIEHL
jgi:hypothetical protein